MALRRVDGPGGPHRPVDPGATRAPRKAEETRPAAGDRIDLSPEARVAARLTDAAMRLPEIRTDKVETVRRSLADGTYRVDPQTVARAILEFEDGFPR